MRIGRALPALVAVLAAATAALGVARVDTSLGAPFGPDRRMAVLDAAPAPAQLRAASARAILRARPVDGRAYRVLALDAATAGQGNADALLAAAERRWPRDPYTQAALADRALAAGDIAGGLEHLDALLRVAPWIGQQVLPLLLPHLGDARMRDALAARLALDPPWRAAFAAVLRNAPAQARDTDALLARVAARTPLTPAELDLRIDALERLGQAARARRLWQASLPPAQRDDGLMFDGGFERDGVDGGFGWRLAPPPGVDLGLDAVAPYEGHRALSLGFPGRAIAVGGISQRLALPAGRYVLVAATRDDTGSARPFEWRIECSDGPVLADLPLRAPGQWRRQSVQFEVPASCGAQRIQLRHTARSLVERQLSGTLAIDGLGIFLGR